MAAVLDVRNLSVGFGTSAGFAPVVHEVGFRLERGRTLCIVGESGSGKSVTCHAVLGLLARSGRRLSGEVLFEGRDLAGLTKSELDHLRGGRIGMIFQDPVGSLDPLRTVGGHLDEVLQLHTSLGRQARLDRSLELLQLVGIPAARQRLGAYPHQLSGGMAQRVMIALAIACDPVLLIADEPTTALDVTIQAQIIDLLRRLQAESGMAMLFVTHDLGVVVELADEVLVMRLGRVVEQGDVDQVFRRPQAEYTRELLAAVPRLASPAPVYRGPAAA